MKNALTIILALASAAWAGPKPDWLDGSSMEYPRERYLVGIGLGDDQASAKDRSRGEIARVFSSLVTVTTDLSEAESTVKTGEKSAATFSQSVSQNVQTASKKLLEGVDVVETWQDPATKQHYALAVLERSKGVAAVADKLAELDKQASDYKGQLDTASEKLPRVKAAMKLLTLLRAREELNAELRVLDPGGKGRPGPVDAAAVKPLAAKALAALEVRVDVTGPGSKAIETGAVKGLNGFGFQAAAGPAKGPVDILVEGPVDTKPMEGGDKRWKWARSSVTLSLKDGGDKIFLRVEASERQASADYQEAVRRSLAELSKKVAKQIDAGIAEYFENQ